nr:reverse transcriptase domain-containing protein [Tanacetum cinerariifolium]
MATLMEGSSDDGIRNMVQSYSQVTKYFPTSPRNNSFDSNSSGLVPIALLALSLFHDDPYMKVMQAYDVTDNESPISLPRVRSPPIRYEESFWIQSMSSRNTREDHHHQTTRLDPYHVQLFRIQPLAAIRQLIDDRVAAALEAQSANMTNTDNTNGNLDLRETHAARKCSYKEFMSCQPFNFKGSKGAVGLIHWFERTEAVFSRSNYIEDCKELATLCSTMVSDSKKMMEAFIGGLPRSIEGNVTASKPQTLEEAINITQRLMDQVLKHNHVQETNDHK